jgi:CRISPR-associated protein Cas1
MNLKKLPKFSDRLPFVYIEKAIIERDNYCWLCHQESSHSKIPIAQYTAIMIGPGVSITHAAICLAAEMNTLLLFVGEEGVRFYCSGLGGTRKSRNFLRQVELFSDKKLHMQIVLKMYEMRFGAKLDENLTINQIRAAEGNRVRSIYVKEAKKNGLEWNKRDYKFQSWDYSDVMNKALSCANACLYGISHAAIVSCGFSPALGFVHTGHMTSFVFDIADLYKTDISVPLAFSTIAQHKLDTIPNIERCIRIACRDIFAEKQLLSTIVKDILTLFEITGDEEEDKMTLWSPEAGIDKPIKEL